MRESVACQLVGGPFDGDKGGCVTPLPDRMYVWGCKTPPAFCPSDGVHWDRVLKMSESEVYIHTEEREGVEFYVHEDLRLQPADSSVEETPAPREEASA